MGGLLSGWVASESPPRHFLWQSHTLREGGIVPGTAWFRPPPEPRPQPLCSSRPGTVPPLGFPMHQKDKPWASPARQIIIRPQKTLLFEIMGAYYRCFLCFRSK